jgi:hypothetical protein
MYRAFPTAADPTDRAIGPLSPLPCQAWHGYGVSSAHHGEVRDADGPASAPPSGAAAATPPAGAQERQQDTICCYGLPFSPAPGGLGKSRLGGEMRRGEQRYLGRGSARIGTELSTTCARGFSHAFPPWLKHDRSRTKTKVR